jgi:hypothetical protein
VILSFAVGLPFGIKGVALCGSVALMLILPFVLKFSFHGTALSLRRIGEAVVCPILICVAGVGIAKTALHFCSPSSAPLQLLLVGLCFATVYSLALLIPAARKDLVAIISVFRSRGRMEAVAAGGTG